MADKERYDLHVVLPWSFVALTLCWVSYEDNFCKWGPNEFTKYLTLIWNIYGLKKQGY